MGTILLIVTTLLEGENGMDVPLFKAKIFCGTHRSNGYKSNKWKIASVSISVSVSVSFLVALREYGMMRKKGWGYSSVVQCLLGTCKALGKKKKNKKTI
jgi:hypothetical protein